MPCYVPLDNSQTPYELNKKIQALSKDLCRACQILHRNNLMDDQLQTWFVEHRDNDRANMVTATSQEIERMKKTISTIISMGGMPTMELEDKLKAANELLDKVILSNPLETDLY